MYKKPLFKICGALACGTIIFKKLNDFNSKPIYASNLAKNTYPTSAEYPELIFNVNLMSKNLTDYLYSKLRYRKTKSGFSIDEAIQTGVDNIGNHKSCGIVAGDEESYRVFGELFDLVIKEKHFGYQSYQEHKTDLNTNNLKIDEPLDKKYVLSLQIKAIRNIRGFCLPTFCSRGERRDIENLIVGIFYNEKKRFKFYGTYRPVAIIQDTEKEEYIKNGFWIDKPDSSKDISSNLHRDWPDARGIWTNDDQNISVYLNRKDHCLITVREESGDLKKTFKIFSEFMNEIESHLKDSEFEFMHDKHLGYITTSPSNLGTAMKISVLMKIPNLTQDSRLIAVLKKINLNFKYRLYNKKKQIIRHDEADKDTIVEISSLITLGKSEVEVAQSFAESIKNLVEIEKKMENGDSIMESF